MAAMGWIENVVVGCVNDALLGLVSTSLPIATVETLYAGATKPPLAVAIARQFCFFVMHDKYHISYAMIARRSGFRVRNVIRNAGKARDMVYHDRLYKAVKILVDSRI